MSALREATPEVMVAAPAEEAKRGRHPLLGFLLRRTAAGILTLLVVSMLVFAAVSVLPGNAAEALLGKNATPSQLAYVSHQMGLSRPLVARYLSWLGGIVHGNLGYSAAGYAQGAKISVWSHIGTPLGNSLILATCVMVLLVPLALVLATASSLKDGGFLDHSILTVTLALISLPEFVLGSLLILFFATWLHVLPAVSLVPYGSTVLSNPDILVLPVLTLIGITLGASVRMIRACMIEARRSEYVKMARLNGLPETQITFWYALRNSVAPAVQVFAQNLQYLLGGIVVTEYLFNYPGIGTELVNAVSLRDVSEVQSTVVIIAAVYIAVNIIADFLVVLLVPKLRTA
jgi:peptide/nickel transport system permease protein